MFVAFYFPNNEGVVAALITGPGFDSESHLVDAYEVDAEVKSFDTERDATDWLAQYGLDDGDFKPVPGGLLHTNSL